MGQYLSMFGTYLSLLLTSKWLVQMFLLMTLNAYAIDNGTRMLLALVIVNFMPVGKALFNFQ